MAFPKKLLGANEEVVLHMRTHWKKLIVPTLILLVALVAGVWLWVITDQPAVRWIIVAVAAAAIILGWVRPLITWLCSTDTLTTKRLISRSGVFTRRGRDLPLDRVNTVSYERHVIDRILGCGTLIVETAGKDSTVVLEDVPRAELVHLKMQELLLDIDIPEKGEPAHEPKPGERAAEVPTAPEAPSAPAMG